MNTITNIDTKIPAATFMVRPTIARASSSIIQVTLTLHDQQEHQSIATATLIPIPAITMNIRTH